MNTNEMRARIRTIEVLLEMMARELPQEKQHELMDRLIDRSTGDDGLTEVAEHWDYRVTRRKPGRSPEDDGNPANAMDEILARTRRRIQIFGPPEP